MLPMTIADLRCDGCGRPLAGLASDVDAVVDTTGLRFVYHPGRADLRDDAGLLCGQCWADTVAWFGVEAHLGPAPCPRCELPPDGEPRLHVSLLHDLHAWQLCTRDAVAFLNRLRTVEPKLDPETFVLPAPRDQNDSG